MAFSNLLSGLGSGMGGFGGLAGMGGGQALPAAQQAAQVQAFSSEMAQRLASEKAAVEASAAQGLQAVVGAGGLVPARTGQQRRYDVPVGQNGQGQDPGGQIHDSGPSASSSASSSVSSSVSGRRALTRFRAARTV